MQPLFSNFLNFFRSSKKGPRRGPLGTRSAAAATVTAAVVVAAATAATTAAAAPAGAGTQAAATAAEDEDEDQDDPQTAIPATIIPHKPEPPTKDGDRPAISVHLMRQGPGCAPHPRFSPRMVRVGLQHRSSMSEMVAAGIRKAPSHRAQNSSTEL